MTPIHAISGMFFLFVLNYINPEMFPFSGLLIVLSLVLPMLPDLDSLWIEKMKDHHQSFTHAPLFWVTVSIVVYFFIPWLSILIFFQLMGHFLGDYIAAFSAGIAWFYPFNKKETSLYPLHKELGNYAIFAKTAEDKRKRMLFMKEYYKHKKLVVMEIVAVVLGIFSSIMIFLKK